MECIYQGLLKFLCLKELKLSK